MRLAFDSSGNLFVSNFNAGTVSEFAPKSTTPTATLTGVYGPEALAFDSNGNLFVANAAGGTVSEFAPRSTVPTVTLSGLAYPSGVAFDSSGKLFVTNHNGITVSEFAPVPVPAAGSVVIRTALPSQTMSIGGNAAGANINLTSAELEDLYTTAAGSITFGDSSQTGTITFNSATPATTAGAGTVVVQAAGGTGQIILNEQGTGPALNGNGGTVQLTPGTGGVEVVQSSAEANDVVIVSNGFTSPAAPLSLSLNFVPTGGTQITLVSNTATPTASNPISGTFSNLADGGTISATYNGQSYVFRANYEGGDGNDLVLTDTTPLTSVTSLVLSGSSGVGIYGGTTSATATLTSNGAPVANETISFSLHGVSLGTATNNASGVATLSGIGLSGYNAGTFKSYLAASFVGDSSYASSGATADLVVNQAPLTVNVGNDSQIEGSPANLGQDLGATIATGVNGENLAITYSSLGDTTAAAVGAYPITATLTNGSGLLSNYNVTLTNGTLTVNDAPLTATATPISAVEGQPLNNVKVATFTDANPTAPLSDFPLTNVTISWGDGTTSNATAIMQPGGVGTPFVVFGSHTYAEEGPSANPLTVTITDVGGMISNTGVVAAGLVSQWTGDGTAADQLGTNNGTLPAGAGYTTGPFGQAFVFDGTQNSYLQAPTSGLPTGSADRTLAAWVRIDANVPGAGEVFFAGYGNFGSSGQSYQLGANIDGSGDHLFFSQWGGEVRGGPALQLGQWYHIAVTTGDGVSTLYVDGEAVASGSLGISTPSNTNLYLGRLDSNLRARWRRGGRSGVQPRLVAGRDCGIGGWPGLRTGHGQQRTVDGRHANIAGHHGGSTF